MKKLLWAAYLLLPTAALACLAVFFLVPVFFPAAAALTVEAGSPPPQASDFLRSHDAKAVFIDGAGKTDTSVLGESKIEIRDGTHRYITSLKIVDTVPPAAAPVPETYLLGSDIVPADFVSQIRDATAVTLKFDGTPDLSAPGIQNIKILLTDAGGNTAAVTSTLRLVNHLSSLSVDMGSAMPAPSDFITDTDAKSAVSCDMSGVNMGKAKDYPLSLTLNGRSVPVTLHVGDSIPPVITGPKTLYVMVGGTISYKKDLIVTDNSGETPTLTVDSSKVDLDTEGEYPAAVTATDGSGNSTVFEMTVVVNDDLTSDTVDALADNILARIIKPGMTDREKCRAIYNWVGGHVYYIDHGDKTSSTFCAYTAFTKGYGDCYTFCSASEYLLTRAGIENMRIQRVPTYTRQHFWNLVKIDGQWYHFDALPYYIGRTDQCLFTDSVAKQLTAQRGRGYYEYNPSLYPAVAP